MFKQALIKCGRRLHQEEGYVKFFHGNSSSFPSDWQSQKFLFERTGRVVLQRYALAVGGVLHSIVWHFCLSSSLQAIKGEHRTGKLGPDDAIKVRDVAPTLQYCERYGRSYDSS